MSNNDLADRLVGKLTVKVLRAYNLKEVAVFGKQNPQVSVCVNDHKEYTTTKDDAGTQAEWNETLHFNVDCQPDDLVHIKVKHDRFAADVSIGIFSLSVADFIKYQLKTIKFELVDEETFQSTGGVVEVIPEYIGSHQPPVYQSPEPVHRM